MATTTRKTIVIASSVIAILAGFICLTPPGKMLLNYATTGNAAVFTNSETAKNLSVTSSERPSSPFSPLSQAVANETLFPFARQSTRSTRWRNAKSALSINAQIQQLLNDGDLENPRFAYSLFMLCEQASLNKSSEQVPEEALQVRLKEYANGKPFVAPITPEEMRMSRAIIDSGLSKNTVVKKRALSDSFAARCGGLMSDELGLKLVNAIENSIKAGSVLGNAPYGDLKSDSSFAALEKVIRDPDLASVWLPIKRDFLDNAAQKAGYFEGLNNDDQKALVWMVICNFGGDCADDGITRLDACLTSYLCDGNSVAEAVANAVGKDKVSIIAARANKLSLDLAISGAGFFKSPSR
jgi:hypothetical protein